MLKEVRQCNVFHIIIANWGTQFIDREGIYIKARKGEVRVGGTEEVQGAANIICDPPNDFKDKGDDTLTTR